MVTSDMLSDIAGGECDAGLWEQLAAVPFLERRKGCNMAGFTGFRPNVSVEQKHRAIELEYESQEMNSQGYYHVGTQLFFAAAALRRGDDLTAEICVEAAAQELAAVKIHDAMQLDAMAFAVGV